MRNLNRHFIMVMLVVLFSYNQVLGAGTIACAGTSITLGNKTEYASYGIFINAGGWPSLLQAKVGTEYTVSNLGLGGRYITCPDTPAGNKASYWNNGKVYIPLLSSKPTICIIEFGTNDSRPDVWPYCGKKFAFHYGRLIDSVKKASPSCRIYPCFPTPLFFEKHIYQDSILVHHIIPAIDSIARFKNLQVIDLRTPFLQKSSLFKDGCHPDSAGMRIIAETVFKTINTASFANKNQQSKNKPNFRAIHCIVQPEKNAIILKKNNNLMYSIHGRKITMGF